MTDTKKTNKPRQTRVTEADGALVKKIGRTFHPSVKCEFCAGQKVLNDLKKIGMAVITE